MALKQTFKTVLNQPAVVLSRTVLGELAVGLAFSWLMLISLEIIRPGMVSLYLDLNLLLVAVVLTWLGGAKIESRSITWYAGVAFFALLVVILIWRLLI